MRARRHSTTLRAARSTSRTPSLDFSRRPAGLPGGPLGVVSRGWADRGPSCRVGWAGSTGRWGFFLVARMVGAGQPGRGLADGERGGDRCGPGPVLGQAEPHAAAAACNAPGDGEDPRLYALPIPTHPSGRRPPASTLTRTGRATAPASPTA